MGPWGGKNGRPTFLNSEVLKACCSHFSTRLYRKRVFMEKKYSNLHTHHCCKSCGCKYGDDKEVEDPFDNYTFIPCPVVDGRDEQEHECNGNCLGSYDE